MRTATISIVSFFGSSVRRAGVATFRVERADGTSWTAVAKCFDADDGTRYADAQRIETGAAHRVVRGRKVFHYTAD